MHAKSAKLVWLDVLLGSAAIAAIAFNLTAMPIGLALLSLAAAAVCVYGEDILIVVLCRSASQLTIQQIEAYLASQDNDNDNPSAS